MPIDPAIAEANGHVTRLRAQVRTLEGDKRRMQRELDEHEAHERAIERAGSLKFKPFAIEAAKHGAHSPGYPMTMWSDWHWGEPVLRHEVGGVNAFNRKIALKRVENLVSGTINLLRNYGGL